MKTTGEILADIQQRIKAPKSQYNQFGKFAYRSCEDILEALKPLLREHGAIVVMDDEIVERGTRVYVKARACIGLPGRDEMTCVSAYAREPEAKRGMDEMQITGAASSYARKTALAGLFALDDNRDSDTVEEKPKITAAQVEEVRTLLAENDLEEARLVAWMKKSLKCSSIEDLNEDGFDTVIKRIQAAKK